MLRKILLLLTITVGATSGSVAAINPVPTGRVIVTLVELQAKVDLLTQSMQEGIAAVSKLEKSEAADQAAIKALQAQVANLTDRLENMQAVHPTPPLIKNVGPAQDGRRVSLAEHSPPARLPHFVRDACR